MRQRIIRKSSDGEVVDFAKLNTKQLIRMHYEEEKYMAQLISKSQPFSKERAEYLKEMYDFANAIMPWYKHGARTSYGANERSVGVICKFLREDKRESLLYEAGVGVGYSCRRFVEISGVKVQGCDIILTDEVKALMSQNKNLAVDEGTLYDNLKKMDDSTIDYFYADNVIEHLLPDEFPQILRLLSRKLKKGGILFLVIPNRLTGPHDVSRYFVKKGQRAEGAHFMEMSYLETISKFKKLNIQPEFFTWMYKGKIIVLRDRFQILNRIKLCIEEVAGFVVKKTGHGMFLFDRLAMSYYVLVQK